MTPVVSGHTYGSAYWTIKTENEQFAYLSASNPSATDVKLMETAPLRAVDHILVTSLSRLVDTTAKEMGYSLIKTITDVLKKHGSVLLPICPVGPIFEMIEAVSDIITTTVIRKSGGFHNLKIDFRMEFPWIPLSTSFPRSLKAQ